MPIFRGFILSSVKFGDEDAVLHTFTKEEGYQSFFIHKIFAPKNRKRAYLFPLNELDFAVSKIREGKLSSLSKLELKSSVYEENNLYRNCILMFAADFLNQVLREENSSEKIYHEIDNFLNHVHSGYAAPHIPLLFTFLKYQGLVPLVSEEKFLNPESGKYEDAPVHQLFSENVSAFWKKFSKNEDLYAIKLSREKRNDVLESVLMYYRLHFQDFRTPNSLEIIREVLK